MLTQRHTQQFCGPPSLGDKKHDFFFYYTAYVPIVKTRENGRIFHQGTQIEQLFYFHIHICYIVLSIKLVNYHLKPNDTYMSHRVLGSFPARWSIRNGQLRPFCKALLEIFPCFFLFIIIIYDDAIHYLSPFRRDSIIRVSAVTQWLFFLIKFASNSSLRITTNQDKTTNLSTFYVIKSYHVTSKTKRSKL